VALADLMLLDVAVEAPSPQLGGPLDTTPLGKLASLAANVYDLEPDVGGAGEGQPAGVEPAGHTLLHTPPRPSPPPSAPADLPPAAAIQREWSWLPPPSPPPPTPPPGTFVPLVPLLNLPPPPEAGDLLESPDTLGLDEWLQQSARLELGELEEGRRWGVGEGEDGPTPQLDSLSEMSYGDDIEGGGGGSCSGSGSGGEHAEARGRRAEGDDDQLSFVSVQLPASRSLDDWLRESSELEKVRSPAPADGDSELADDASTNSLRQLQQQQQEEEQESLPDPAWGGVQSRLRRTASDLPLPSSASRSGALDRAGPLAADSDGVSPRPLSAGGRFNRMGIRNSVLAAAGGGAMSDGGIPATRSTRSKAALVQGRMLSSPLRAISAPSTRFQSELARTAAAAASSPVKDAFSPTEIKALIARVKSKLARPVGDRLLQVRQAGCGAPRWAAVWGWVGIHVSLGHLGPWCPQGPRRAADLLPARPATAACRRPLPSHLHLLDGCDPYPPRPAPHPSHTRTHSSSCRISSSCPGTGCCSRLRGRASVPPPRCLLRGRRSRGRRDPVWRRRVGGGVEASLRGRGGGANPC
jgi:hypothetical protein